jgi:hypothetical protein
VRSTERPLGNGSANSHVSPRARLLSLDGAKAADQPTDQTNRLTDLAVSGVSRRYRSGQINRQLSVLLGAD